MLFCLIISSPALLISYLFAVWHFPPYAVPKFLVISIDYSILVTSSMDANATTDIGAIWQEACKRYEEVTKASVSELEPVHDVEAVSNKIRSREQAFKGFRHDETKLDKFRTLVKRSLKPIETVGNIVASAASTVIAYILSDGPSVYKLAVLPAKYRDFHGSHLSDNSKPFCISHTICPFH